uniref:MAM domain-containing glycosylphosphatidylinositol anchor protein 1 n=1 Tax=Pavo cristatus TaxID=9049 RepID=A0A8C9EPS2_PAVCR
MEMICVLFLSLVPAYSRGQGVYGKRLDGSTLVLSCLLLPWGCCVRWTKTAGSASDKFQETSVLNETLRIEKIQRLQGGRYYCKAENGVGVPAIKSIRVDVQYLDEPVLTVHQTISDVRGSFYQEKTVFLRCTVNSNPPARFIWKRGAETLSHSQDNGVDIYEPLYTQDVPRQDAASISLSVPLTETCSVLGAGTAVWYQLYTFLPQESVLPSHSQLSYFVPGFHQSLFISLLVPPTISVPKGQSTITVREGSRAELQCEVRGKPKPPIIWSRVDKETPMPSGTMTVETYDGKLHLESVSREMSGTYKCQTARYNGFNIRPREAMVQLNVQFPPVVEPAFQDVRQGMGRSVTLRCTMLKGSPMKVATSVWRFNGTLLAQPPAEQQDYSELKVDSVSRETSGSYECSISNDVGVSACLFQVSAKAYSPEFYYDTPNPTLSQKQSKNYSYILQWTQKEPDAVDPILKYRLEVRQLAQRNIIQTFIPVQKMEKGLLLEHILLNLKVPQSYEVRLTPITSFGAGDMAARIIRYMEPINYPSPTDNTCRFEDEKICGFVQDKMDNFDWTRQNALTQNPKRTVNTGPPTDISGTPEGYYMFIEASRPRVTGDKARLISPLYNITAKYYCVSFYYHMYGKHIGSLNLLVRVRNKRAIDTQVWSLSGNRGNMWQQAHVPINPPGPFQIIFEGVRGTSYEGDIAIDDVTLKKGDCPRKPIGPNKAVALPGSGVPAQHGPCLCGPLTFFLYVLLR